MREAVKVDRRLQPPRFDPHGRQEDFEDCAALATATDIRIVPLRVKHPYRQIPQSGRLQEQPSEQKKEKTMHRTSNRTPMAK